jgi:hypothetical protein
MDLRSRVRTWCSNCQMLVTFDETVVVVDGLGGAMDAGGGDDAELGGVAEGDGWTGMMPPLLVPLAQ